MHGFMTITQIVSLVEHSIIATATGVITGKLILPGLWKDLKHWRSEHRDSP